MVGLVDNLLQPTLIGRDSGMPELIVFFSAVGGIGLFGVTGFIVGPVIAALFLTLLEIYGKEFSQQLAFVHNHVNPELEEAVAQMLAPKIGAQQPVSVPPSSRAASIFASTPGAQRGWSSAVPWPTDAEPARVICLDAPPSTYHYWHAFVPGLGAGQVYAYRADGPFDPARGLRFDPAKVLLDPYGRAVVVPDKYDRSAASRPGENTAVAMRSVVVDPGTYDWEGDARSGGPSPRR